MIERSALLDAVRGVIHGFSTRAGGTSEGPFDSMNLGFGLGDADERVRDNLACLRAHAGLGDEVPFVQIEQVHGAEVVLVEREAERPTGDALVTWTPNVAVGVRTADCTPILIAHAKNGRADAVAAVHAGWRGATAGVLIEAIRTLESLGATRRALSFALGPSIGPEAFEVGEEVIEAARRALDGEAPPFVRVGAKPHLDLRGLLERQLRRHDIEPSQIQHVGGCTHADPHRYFSHRRERGRTGRHLSFIALLDA